MAQQCAELPEASFQSSPQTPMAGPSNMVQGEGPGSTQASDSAISSPAFTSQEAPPRAISQRPGFRRMQHALQREPWQSFEERRALRPTSFTNRELSTPDDMIQLQHQEDYRTARDAFLTDYAEELHQLAEVQRRISDRLVERRGHSRRQRGRERDVTLGLLQEEAMRELVLLINGPRRPDGRDQCLGGETRVIPFDLAPAQARAFIAANRVDIEPYAMDLVDLIRATRRRRTLVRKWPISREESLEMAGLARTMWAVRQRMPEWEQFLVEGTDDAGDMMMRELQ